ncbi:hypothetical protein [Halobacillus sp. Marseille-Q1614]|uniref:hypothetical protein n=1 Tax=Halobacillus sp. Marseille-Q1614 TaxID=2709134 RepID=UPI001570EA36|nr:hypothetical protein [Halobacillus sp. Marseille-Q1614]
MEHFPIIHTNFWDVIIAVPSVIILTQLFKMTFAIPKGLIPTLANIIGLFIAVFIAHPNNLWAGLFMGFFYGNAAVGGYASLKTALLTYRKRKRKSLYAKT